MARDGVTNSLLQKWLGCRVAARYYLDKIRPDVLSAKITLGSIFHALLETHYGEPGCDAFGIVAPRWRDKTIESGGNLQEMEGVLAQAHALYIEYRKRWVKDDEKKEWVQLEGVFDVKWRGHRLRGRCDGLYRDASGKLWLLETKTKSRIPESLDTSLTFDPQNLFYITAKEAELGEPIMGVLYNVIRQPSLRQKQSETHAQFFERTREDIETKPEHYFMRYELRYGDQDRKRFEEELVDKLDHLDLWVAGKLPTYRSECSCVRGWTCEYLPLCAGVGGGFNQNGTLFSELED